MTEYIYHTGSIQEIIPDHGPLDTVLCFSQTPYYVHYTGEQKIYRFMPKKDFINANMLFIDPDNRTEEVMSLVSEFAAKHRIDAELAESLIDESENVFRLAEKDEEDGEDNLPPGVDEYMVAFESQMYAAKIAKRLGYEGAVGTDEQGPVFLVDMLGREDELEDVTGVEIDY